MVDASSRSIPARVSGFAGEEFDAADGNDP